MANRVLRDWTLSNKVDNLTSCAEVFFTRLLMKADDFGSFYSDPKILKSLLYPLKDKLTLDQINSWVEECRNNGLISLYNVDGKDYLRIVEFGQRLRNMKGKFPQPNDPPLNVSESPPETKRNKKQETETETNIPPENEFLDYCKIQLAEKYESYEFSLKNKYKAWVSNSWKDGNDNKIKNWKTKILNTIPYLKQQDGKQQNNNNREHRIASVSNLKNNSLAILGHFEAKNGDTGV